MEVKPITSLEEFRQLTQGSTPVAIDFWATWCGPCRVISPIFEQLSKKYPNVKCYKVDVDERQDISNSVGVRAMPTFQVYQNGEKVGEVVGARPPLLESLLAKHHDSVKAESSETNQQQANAVPAN